VTGPSGSGSRRCCGASTARAALLGRGAAGAGRGAGWTRVMHGPRRLSRSVGFVFQDPDAQHVAPTVEDEIAFGMEQHGSRGPRWSGGWSGRSTAEPRPPSGADDRDPLRWRAAAGGDRRGDRGRAAGAGPGRAAQPAGPGSVEEVIATIRALVGRDDGWWWRSTGWSGWRRWRIGCGRWGRGERGAGSGERGTGLSRRSRWTRPR
jgi:hypothetical protein